MLQNFIKVFFRQMLKHKGFSFINIFGLAIGITFSTIIFLWVEDQFKINKDYPDSERIHYLMTNQSFDDKTVTWTTTPGLLASTIQEKYPEVELATVVGFEGTNIFQVEDKTINALSIASDDSFFKIFGATFLEGSSDKLLVEENVAVITESGAKKIFNSLDVIGNELAFENNDRFKISAVIKDFNQYSGFSKVEVILPFQYYHKRYSWINHWGNSSFQTYAKLHADADIQHLNEKLNGIIPEYMKDGTGKIFAYPLGDYHLKGRFVDGKQNGGQIVVLKVFFIIGIFIILIGCINFMNLTTAKSVLRSKEIGVRKVIGATKNNLVLQFYAEVFLYTFSSVLLALVFIELTLPYINQLIERQLFMDFKNVKFWLTIISIISFTTLVAGSYPALYMSSFNTIKVLKGILKSGKGALVFRQSLVVFQFCLSIILIITTIFLYKQIHFLKNKELGFDKDDVISYYPGRAAYEKFDQFRSELLTYPGIKEISRSSSLPFRVGSSTSDPEWEGKDPNIDLNFHIIRSDANYLSGMNIKLLAGRNFDDLLATDTINYLVNKKAADMMGFTDPIGKQLKVWRDTPGQIIGLVDDFHNQSLHKAIEPLIITYDPENTWLMSVKAETGKGAIALESLKAVHEKFMPGYPIQYSFMDEQYNRMYRVDTFIGKLSAIFGSVAILISCLGLFGLSAFSIEQRTREIGIRKVLGSSVVNLVWKLSSNFTKLIVLALIISAPLSYFLVSKLLNMYSYRIGLTYEVGLLCALLVITIAWATIGFHSIKAARTNPVNVLRSE
jgi:putative ABC transport system permease protein